ncbi:hypothetical protein CbuG_1822 [Coxiella burnetii CbuG_Q212]|nr:hypothetical protein CbuG_1822 [Coxiella burnetii CbuG_Q212]
MKALSREMYGFLRDREQEKYLRGVETVKENREELAAIRERLMKVGGERIFSRAISGMLVIGERT